MGNAPSRTPARPCASTLGSPRPSATWADSWCSAASARGLEHLDRAIQLAPNLAYAYSLRGTVRLSVLNDVPAALSDFNIAVDLAPNDPEVRSGRGLVRYAMRHLDGALDDFTRAIQLNPTNVLVHAQAYANRGVVLLAGGDAAAAIGDFDAALRLHPGYDNAYTNRGLARRELGDLEGALADYNIAIRLNPNSHDAYNGRGAVRLTRGAAAEALADLNEALRLNPSFATAYANRALAREALGDEQGAREDRARAQGSAGVSPP